MNLLSKAIDVFIYPKDKETIVSYRKSKFFVSSLVIFIIVNAIFFAIIYQGAPIEDKSRLLYTSIFVTILMFIPVVIYKYLGKRLLIVNIFSVIVYSGFYDSYAHAGGIYSFDLTWYAIVMPAWISIAASKNSGIFWLVVALIFAAFLTYADMHSFLDFREKASQIPSFVILFNLILAGGLTMSFIYVYEINNDKYNKEITAAKIEVENKSKELEAQKEDIISSINYAKRIQYAVLPQEENIYRSIPLSFILYKPKDIVSGDFFWFHEIDKDNYIIVCADCTGHGVPGALMTVIGSSLLNQIVIDNKITQPSKILSELDKLINATLKQQKEHEHYVQDGMDLALLKVDKNKKEFIYTSAKRPLILIRDKQMQEYKGSKFTLGGMVSGEKVFEEIKINYKEDDVVYMFTDGYTDQFGGTKGKKYSIRQLRENLLSVHKQQMSEQKKQLDTTIEQWRSNLEQVDDILLMGIKF